METRRDRAVVGAVVVVAALVILAPALRPGYVLTYDMVFVPRQPLTRDLIALGWATPRAVPSDLVVALASHVVPGQVVQKLILLGIVIGAGYGAGRLCPLGGIAPAATALAYVWTPYLGSRLLIGQWAVLVGYAALPWVLRAGLDARRGVDGGALRLIGVLALGALGGASSWLIVAPASLASLLGHRPPLGFSRARPLLGSVLAACLVFALPWALPALLRPERPGTDLVAAAGFAAQPDTRLGAVGSVLSGGAMWNGGAEVGGHGTYVYAIGALVILVVAAFGWHALRHWEGVGAVAVVGLLGLTLALVSVVPFLRHALAELPGGGLVRDATRYLPGWILLLAVGFGAGVEAARERLRATSWGPAVTLLVALPVVVLPALGWGVGNRLHPVAYPHDIAAAVQVVDRDPRPGVVAVLPFTTYRAYPWNGRRPVLDVLARWFSRPVVYASDLPITVYGRSADIAGDDPFAATVGRQLQNRPPRSLGSLGVRWIVVDATTPRVDVNGLIERFRGPDIAVYEVPNVEAHQAGHPSPGLRPSPGLVILGAIGWLTVFAGTLGVWVCRSGYCLVTSARRRA